MYATSFDSHSINGTRCTCTSIYLYRVVALPYTGSIGHSVTTTVVPMLQHYESGTDAKVPSSPMLRPCSVLIRSKGAHSRINFNLQGLLSCEIVPP